MSQPNQLVGERTRINPVFCRAQSRPHFHPHAEAAGFERQPVFRSWSTPPPTGASLQSFLSRPPPYHPTFSFSLKLPQAPAGCTSAAGPPGTGRAERTFSRFAGLWGHAQVPRILHLLPSLRRLGAPWLGDEALLPGPQRDLGISITSRFPRAGVPGRGAGGALQLAEKSPAQSLCRLSRQPGP